MSEVPIEKMRIYELRNKLKEKGLSGSGTKSELIARLTEYYSQHKEEGQSQEVSAVKEVHERWTSDGT